MLGIGLAMTEVPQISYTHMGAGDSVSSILNSVICAAILVPGCIPSESVETSQAQTFEITRGIGSVVAVTAVRFRSLTK